MSLWPPKRERSSTKIEVGVLGAAGIAGQQLVALLEAHPWFELIWLGAEGALRGKRYGDLAWALAGKIPDCATDLRFEAPRPDGSPGLVFSALDAVVAGELVASFASSGHYVFGHAPNFLTDPLIPLLVPGVNAQHVGLLDEQRGRRWSGAVVNTPSWSTLLLAVVLAALRDFELRRVMLTVLAVRSTNGVDQVVEAEEERVEREVQNVLGQMEEDSIRPCPVCVSVQAAYGDSSAGYTELVSVEFARRVPMEQVADAFRGFSGAPQALRLPSAPAKPIVFHEEGDGFDLHSNVTTARNLTVHVGHLRRCAVLDYKFAVHSSDPILGSAAASLLNAELVVARALFARFGTER
jgi:aspartate-semialdehyde dehydrogenase